MAAEGSLGSAVSGSALTSLCKAIMIPMTSIVNILTMPETASDTESAALNELVARRVAQLRKERQLSFDQLAARSGISKGMVVQIAQGRANPSIGTLTRLAASLRVSVADLLREDTSSSSPVRISRTGDAAVLWRGPKGGSATLLVGSDGPDMVELWEWILCPGESHDSKPHPRGTTELLQVMEGTLALQVGGLDHLISAGSLAVTRTDTPHAYRCEGRKRTRFTMVVHEPAPATNRP